MTVPAAIEQGSRRGWLLLAPLSGLLIGLTAFMVWATRAPVDPVWSVGAHAVGDPAAPTVVEVWSDLQCPTCRDFDLTVAPQVRRGAVAEGRARLVYRPFVTGGESSARAAGAAECAAEQGRYWAYRRRLQGEYSVRANDAHSDVNLRRYAVELGLDRPAFDACLDGGRYASLIVRETEAGRAKGVRGVPTVFVDERQLSSTAELPRILELAGMTAPR